MNNLLGHAQTQWKSSGQGLKWLTFGEITATVSSFCSLHGDSGMCWNWPEHKSPIFISHFFSVCPIAYTTVTKISSLKLITQITWKDLSFPLDFRTGWLAFACSVPQTRIKGDRWLSGLAVHGLSLKAEAKNLWLTMNGHPTWKPGRKGQGVVFLSAQSWRVSMNEWLGLGTVTCLLETAKMFTDLTLSQVQIGVAVCLTSLQWF